MSILRFECGMGAAGDMLAAALFELLPEHAKDAFLQTMNELIPGVCVTVAPAKKCGIAGTKFSVSIHGQEEESVDAQAEPHCTHSHGHHHPHAHAEEHEHQHTHHHGRSVSDVHQAIESLPLSPAVRAHAQAVYRLLADAESRAHGEPVEQIHFHEVGELDAIADIVAVCLLVDLLKPDQIFSSPVHVGSGMVRCAHGLLPVPAPATAYLLEGVPMYSGAIRGELCTPTGAALLKHFCSFTRPPVLSPRAYGYGMGTKDFEAANCVRAMLCDAEEATDTVLELRCNLDDMTPEAIGFALKRLWEGPVLDAFTTPIGMKKNRPGTMLTCLCREADAEQVVKLLFQHTATLGIRQNVCARYTLKRTIQQVSVSGERVRIKRASGWGVCREKAEYEDAAAFARNNNLSLSDATNLILRAATELGFRQSEQPDL